MMKKTFLVLLALPVLWGFGFPAAAGERAVPVDIFLLVDKSLSMDEGEKFQGLKRWTEEQLTGQMLVEGDWLTIYQFYGEAENLLTLTISNEADKERVKTAFDGIEPNGRFTDIGQALDAIKASLDRRGSNDRYKIMILLTDLRQEAPWTSRYPGIIDPFTSPYLAEARTVDHGGWYEITLDMDIHDQVVMLSRQLYDRIETLRGEAHDISENNTTFEVSADTGGTNGAGTASGTNRTDNASNPNTESQTETARTPDSSGRETGRSGGLSAAADSAAGNADTAGATASAAGNPAGGNPDAEAASGANEAGVSRAGEEAERPAGTQRIAYTDGGTGVAQVFDEDGFESGADGSGIAGATGAEEESAENTDSAAGNQRILLYILGGLLFLLLLFVVIALIRNRKPSDDKKKQTQPVDLLDSGKWN